jgi:hypothetical protein
MGMSAEGFFSQRADMATEIFWDGHVRKGTRISLCMKQETVFWKNGPKQERPAAENKGIRCDGKPVSWLSSDWTVSGSSLNDTKTFGVS